MTVATVAKAGAKVLLPLAAEAVGGLVKGSSENGNPAASAAVEVNNRVQIDGQSPLDFAVDQGLSLLGSSAGVPG